MKFSTKSGAAAPELLTNLDEDTAVREALTMCERAEGERRAAESAVDSLVRELEGGAEDDTSMADLATRVLAGESAAAMCVDTTKLVAAIADARRRLRICETAETLAQSRLVAARQAAFDKLLPAAKSAYADIVVRMAECLIALRRELRAEEEFRNPYLNGNPAVKLFPGRVYPMGFKFDSDRVLLWFREGVENGLLPQSMLDEFSSLVPQARNW